MYIGVQYMEQNMFETAAEYLKRSLAKCGSDPYLLNEIATYHYQRREWVLFRFAVTFFKNMCNVDVIVDPFDAYSRSL